MINDKKIRTAWKDACGCLRREAPEFYVIKFIGYARLAGPGAQRREAARQRILQRYNVL